MQVRSNFHRPGWRRGVREWRRGWLGGGKRRGWRNAFFIFYLSVGGDSRGNGFWTVFDGVRSVCGL